MIKSKILSLVITLALCLFAPSCTNINANTPNTLAGAKVKKPENSIGLKKKSTTEVAYWSRVTYYHAYEDKWGARVAACPKMRNKIGVGVAAHPDFKFFTNIRIPVLKGKLDGDDKFQVIDRGSAVTKCKAFKGGKISGKKYVFDVFVPKNKLREFARNMPQYTWVIVEM